MDEQTEKVEEIIKKPDYLSIEEFAKLEARIGLVLSAEEVDGSEKLIKFTLDFGEQSPRTILSGIKAWYTPESLIGKQMLFVTNLAPRKMMGMESQGMLMAIDGTEGEPVFLVPDTSFDKKVSPGAKVR
jgi:methionyl-tRNA synthetase